MLHPVTPQSSTSLAPAVAIVVPVHNENTGTGTGLCLEVHDLAVSKLIAGREKDMGFLAGLLRHRLASPDTIKERLSATQIAPERRILCEARLVRLARGEPFS